MHWQNLYVKDIIFLEYCYQTIYLTAGHAGKDIFTKIYGGKERFNDRNLWDSWESSPWENVYPESGGGMAPGGNQGTYVIPHKTQLIAIIHPQCLGNTSYGT